MNSEVGGAIGDEKAHFSILDLTRRRLKIGRRGGLLGAHFVAKIVGQSKKVAQQRSVGQ